MSIPDQIMWKYYEILTDEDSNKVKSLHPKEARQNLAAIITSRYHGEKTAKKAKENFDSVFSKGQDPSQLESFKVAKNGMDIVELIVEAQLAASKKEARRLVEQGGVQLAGHKVNLGQKIEVSKPVVLKVGKRRFKKLIP